ncbi:MAG TPA: hypothetical protein VJC07_00510 [Candidatus Nanoarchaeia archaeon]|nr:hypothetical protein [Candidatus Nanoarchaeia archaeon]
MESVIIPDEIALRNKVSSCKKSGSGSLRVVSDFDKTLTKQFFNGKEHLSSIALIRQGNYLSREFVKKSYALFDEYYPYEVSNSIPLKDKIVKMQEWWEKHSNLLIEHGFNTQVIEDIISKNKLELRDGSAEFFRSLSEHSIPLLIFSAGLGNLIKGFLSRKNFMTSNVHLIANFFDFDDSGKAVSFREPLIHTFNKNEIQVTHEPYRKEISKRKNVILLGDSIGDIGMAEGIKHDTMIKVGFLNDKVDSNIKIFKENFDVVITNDGPMNYVNELLSKILRQKPNKPQSL